MLSTIQTQFNNNNVQVHLLVIDGAEAKSALKYSYDKHKSQKPKRNKSAFLLYSAEKRAQIKAKGEKLNSNEIMGKLADLWNALPQSERKGYEAEAKRDKERYLNEMEIFKRENPDAKDSHNRTKTNHVKKPSSAYGLFLKEATADIKKETPKLLMADVLKIVSYRWKNLSENERAKYQDEARKEKELSQARLGQNLLKTHNISIDSLLQQGTVEKLEKQVKKRVKRENSDSVSTNSNTMSNDYSAFTPSHQQDSTDDFFTNPQTFSSFNSFDDGFLSPLPLSSAFQFEPIHIAEVENREQEAVPAMPAVEHAQEWNMPPQLPFLSREVSREEHGGIELPNMPDFLRSSSQLYMNALNENGGLMRGDSMNVPHLSLDKFPSINLQDFTSFNESWMSFQH